MIVIFAVDYNEIDDSATTLIFRTSLLINSLTSVIQIMVGYNGVDGSSSKLVKKLSKSRRIVKSWKTSKAWKVAKVINLE